MIAQTEALKRTFRSGKYWVLIPLALIVVIALVILETVVLNLISSPDLPLKDTVDIPLAGSPSFFDYQYLDNQTGFLYLTHTGDGALTVFNTVTNRMIANISGIPDIHGVVAVSSVGRAYATDGDDNLVYVIDVHAMRIIAKIPVGDGPDGLIYDPDDHKIFVADEAGQSDGVIDVQTDKRVAEIPLGGDAGDIEYDAVSHHIFSVIETLNQVAVIDPRTYKVIAHYALPGCQSPNDQLIDGQQHLEFIDCADNATLVMVDLQSMTVISSQTIGNNPDLMALDTGFHYLYVASESGVVSVFDEHDRMLRKVAEGYVGEAAHTVAVNQKTHAIYLPLQNFNNQPTLLIAQFAPPS